MVFEWQRLLVLDGAKQREFTRINGQHAASTEGTWIARARVCGERNGHTGHSANKQCNNEAHQYARRTFEVKTTKPELAH